MSFSYEAPTAGTALLVDVVDSGDLPVLHVSGELDMSTARQMLDAGMRMLVDRDSNPLMIIDLTGLDFCDSSGLRVLQQIQRDAAALDRVVVLRSPPHHVVRLLELTRMAERFVVIPFADALEVQTTATPREALT